MESIFIKHLISHSESDDIAIVDRGGQRSTTYRELFHLALKVSSHIRCFEIPEGSFIAVKMPSCMEYVAAEIGIWLSRCAAVPLGGDFPEKRIITIMTHCEALMLIDGSVMEYIKRSSPVADPLIPLSTDNAILFYTSGSTGVPKGVLHGFESMDAGVPRRIVPSIPMEGLVFGEFAPFYFAASNLLYDVLVCGGKVHILSSEIKKDVRLLEDYIAKSDITMCHISPTVLSLFHNRSSTLKTVITAGEKLSGQCSREGYRLFNLYGMTETIFLSSFAVPDIVLDRIPIGTPLRDIRFAILDDNLNQVADGVTGELCVQGTFCKGYYKDPQGTRILNRGGWLHTGDLAYVNTEGLIQYVNRKDWMVKINGQKVEPGEVEQELRCVNGIKAAFVKDFRDGVTGSSYLVGYYIPLDGRTVSEKEIRESLALNLPKFMIPRFFCRIRTIPLNANGKLDRDSLPEVNPKMFAASYKAPETPVQKALCEAFTSVLGLSGIGIDDDFFSLGADSIKVMSLIVKCPDLKLSARTIYMERTPRAIAAAVEKSDDQIGCAVTIGQAVPLCGMQAGIFYECLRRKGQAVYNNPFLFRLGPGVDMARLKDAIEGAVKLHPALFARIFQSADGTAMMSREKIPESIGIQIERISQEEMETIRGSLMQPFNLFEDRLFRIRLFQTGRNRYMFCDFHHIIFDGTSMHILLQDIDAIYSGSCPAGESAGAFDLALQEHLARQTERYCAARQWYRDSFREMETMSLPSPVLNSSGESFGALTFPLAIHTGEIEAFCEKYSTTPNVLTTSAFGFLLASYSAEPVSGFATLYNGRSGSNSERTVGMLVKTLPVLCRCTESKTVRDFLKQTRDQLLGSMANDLFGFAEFAAEKSLKSDIIFTYQGDIFSMPPIGGEALIDEKLPFNATGEILSVDVIESDGELELKTEYRSDLYDEAFIRQFSRCYKNVLHSMMESEDMSEVSILDERMKEEVLSLSHGERIPTSSETIVSLIAAQARRSPDALAIADSNGPHCPYSLLERVSNAVAAKLISQGVQPGDFVCLSTGRGKEFVMAALGVMKAGAAYVPLDMEYPKERLDFMKKDSGAKAFIDEGFFCGLDASAPFVDKSDPESPAYMIYTSGSTGKPKGVVVQHKALSSFVQSIAKLWRLSPSSRISCHCSFCFDASIEDLFPALTVGGSVWIVPEGLRKDLGGLHSYIVSNGITGGCYTTQLGVSLLEFYPDLPVDYLVVGGEYLSSRPKCSCRFINTYGPTEFTVDASYKELPAEGRTDSIPIGRPMPNCCAWILDRMGGLVPQGIVGEICLSGPQIAAGYWNRSEITASRFKEEKCLSGIILYHTGDLGRYNAQGDLEYCGRLDSQIKLRGFRIETGEIDNCISSIPAVRASITSVRTVAGRDTLCSWFLADGSVSRETVRKNLEDRLPDYMIPDVITKVDSFPHLPNGKIDTKALIVKSGDTGRTGFTAPENAGQKALCGILGSITGIERIGIDDDIIKELGLSSLQAIRFVYLAQREGIKISVSQIHSLRTVRALLEKKDDGFFEFIESEKQGAPLVVCTTGYVPFHPYYEETFECLKKEYSILVFDQFFNNFSSDDLAKTLGEQAGEGRRISIDALMDDYWPVFKRHMQKRPIAFIMGVCFGADIAFALANRVLKETGNAYPLMAFDPVYERNQYVGIPQEILDNAALVEKYSISDQLSRTMKEPSYEGKCVFFFPTEELFRKIEELPDIPFSEEELQECRRLKERNDKLVRIHFPDSPVHMLQGHHYNFVDTARMPSVLNIIRKELQ